MTKAFLLTRQAQDTPQGIQLEFWFSSETGPLKVLINQQSAVFFIFQSDTQLVQQLLTTLGPHAHNVDIRPLQLKHFNGQLVAGVYCSSLQVFYRLKELLQTSHLKAFESDIRPAERYLTERFLTGPVSIQARHEHTPWIDPIIKPAEYTPDLRLMSLDIETAYDTNQLYSIAFICNQQKRVLMLSDNTQTISHDDTEFLESESALLKRFIAYVSELDPDVFIGWNVINFDFRFLQKKADTLNIPFRIGRNSSLPRWRQSGNDSSQYFLHIAGRVVLDGIDTLKSATWSFPSFSLEHVANSLLNRGKLIQQNDSHDPLHKAKQIKQQFHNDKQALARYNLEDCQLVLDIFEHAHLMHFAIERARLTGLEMDRVGGSVAAFDNLYLPRLHRKGYIAPNIGDYGSGNTAPGGYVMDSIPGLYDSVLVLDYKSLYPSIIRTFNVDPYSRIVAKQLPDNECIPGYDGASFSKQQFILPEIIAELWKARDKAKHEKNAALSQAIKIIMNSFYGVLGTPGCRIHDARLTSSITKRSHDIIKQTVRLIQQQGYKVIYGDTDSVFVSLGLAYNQQDADKIGHQLSTQINQFWKETLINKYGISSFLEMEYETHFSRFFMPTIRGSAKGSKKRYAGIVLKNNQQKLIFKGLESVRTDWTSLARNFQNALYLKVFNNEPYKEFIRLTVDSLIKGEMDQQLVYRKRLRQSLQQYQKNIPPHARAAINAEAFFKQQGLPSRYQNKGWVEYIMTKAGPQVLECQTEKLDYDHYIEKQLIPIADSILSVTGETMAQVLDRQINLF